MVSGVPACSSFRVEGGELKPAGGVPVSDRGFRYGQHFFETIAVKGGRWGFYQEHLQILQRSGGAAGFVVREEDWAVVEKAPEHPLFRGNPQEGVVRLFWTAGDGGPADPPGIGRIYFTVEHGEVGSVGGKLKLGVKECLREVWWNGWKTGNYWARLEILRAGRKEGMDEMILVSPRGEVVSVCLANVFVRVNGEWLTPPIDDGARPGVVRGFLLREGIGREAKVAARDLEQVEAILVCNSRLGPVRGVLLKDGKQIGGEESEAEFFEELWQKFCQAAWGV